MSQKMKEFKTEEAACEYANNLGKYEYEFAKVDGKTAFLTCTALPEEEHIRSGIEDIVRDFLEMAGFSENDAEDHAAYIGAEMTRVLEDKITEATGVKFLVGYADY